MMLIILPTTGVCQTTWYIFLFLPLPETESQRESERATDRKPKRESQGERERATETESQGERQIPTHRVRDKASGRKTEKVFGWILNKEGWREMDLRVREDATLKASFSSC